MTPTTPPTAKKPRKPRAPKPQRAPRAVDPAIAAIKEEAKRKLAELKASRRGEKLVKKISAILPLLTAVQLSLVASQVHEQYSTPQIANT